MPLVDNAGAAIYWRATGRGEPLVLVMGLGCSSALWFRLAPRLARHYRVILLDNRGVGKTVVNHALVHRVAAMAGDIAAVLDAAGETSAHVLGLSMGGMIAQEFALNHPGRLRSLILAATNCGGYHAVLAEPKVWGLLFSRGGTTPEDALLAMAPYTYAKHTPPDLIDQDHHVRLANYPALQGYRAQLNGLIGWTSYPRLPSLRCPTLVLHGEEDRLIPPANADILATRIPSARLVKLAKASHWLHTDQLDQTVTAVHGFLRGQGTPA